MRRKIILVGMIVMLCLRICTHSYATSDYDRIHEERANDPTGSTTSKPTGQDKYQQSHEDRANGGNGNNGSTTTKTTGNKPAITKERDTSGKALVDPIQNPEEYKPSENPTSNNTQLIQRGNLIIGVIQLLGSAISVITLMILGIRYMLAGVQEKALYKETMGPYLIGAIMVFAIPNIIAVIYDFITGNIKDI